MFIVHYCRARFEYYFLLILKIFYICPEVDHLQTLTENNQ